MTRTIRLALALLLVAALQVGCSGGGGGSDSPSSRGGGGGTTTGGTGGTGITAAQKEAAAVATDTFADVLEAVGAAESALETGAGILGALPRSGEALGLRADAPVFTSAGNAVVEASPPSPETPSGFVRITIYDAALVAGSNYTDSDASGTVSSTAEKDSITAARVLEKTSEFTFDYDDFVLTGTGTVRAYAGTAVERFLLRSYTLDLGFPAGPTAEQVPSTLQVEGSQAGWSGAAAQAASDAVAGGGSPDATSADHRSRFRCAVDVANRRSATDVAATSRNSDGTWRLAIARGQGSLTIGTGTLTISHSGSLDAWERNGPYDLDTEVTLGQAGFAFTPTAGDTRVADLDTNFTSTGDGQGDRVLQGTVRDNLHGITFTFTVQDGLLTGTILADGPNGPVQIATLTLDHNGNGQIVFADGTVVPIENFVVQRP